MKNNPGKKVILSIDIGGSKLMAGLVDLNGKVIIKEKRNIETKATSELLTQNIIEMTDILLKTKDVEIIYAGAAVPGLTDNKEGVLLYAPFSGIRDYKIGDLLKKKFGIEVFVENDANACAYGEMVFGTCKGIDDFIWITLSNGIGGAVVLNGMIYKGNHGGAGEIGHIRVEQNGYECGCGNNGCLEAQAAGPRIVRRFNEKTGEPDKGLTARDIAELAYKGDAAAIEVYRETGLYVGKAISYAVNLINPAKIVIGGGIAQSSGLFMPWVKDYVRTAIIGDPNVDLIIEETALGYDASLIGAAAVAKLGIGGK
jgi:glucokinase